MEEDKWNYNVGGSQFIYEYNNNSRQTMNS